MNHLLNITRCCLCIAIAQLAMASAFAADISAQPRKGYGRINFGFEEPAKLQTSVSGTSAVLTFDKPVAQSAASIKTSLPDYVAAATLSPDKRTVTLTLNQPMRIRQFVSGNSVGVDLIETAPTDEPKLAATPTKPEDLSGAASIKPTAVPPQKEKLKPVALPALVPAAAPAPAKPATSIVAKPKPVKPVVKEVATAPKNPSEALAKNTPAIAKPSPIEKAATTVAETTTPDTSDPMLSTKAPEPIAPTTPPTVERQASPARTEIAPAPQPTDAMLTTKAPEPSEIPTSHDEKAIETSTAPTVVEEPAPPVAKPATVEPVAPVMETPKPAPKPSGPFVVSTRTTNGETTINFPWPERTAAAVFKRSRDIWIVFSQARDVNVGLLRTVLPKSVISATQYAYKGNTVLRLMTDGTVHAKASQAANGYGWDVSLVANAERPNLDVTITADSLEDTTRMILGIFDVAPSLRFFDPNSGEQFTVVPSFEAGRAVASERNFPELTVLASSQGVAMVAKRQDVALNQTRSGLIISSKDGLSMSDNLPLISGTAPVIGASANSGVMLPYDQWFVPKEKFQETMFGRLATVAASTKATKAASMMELVKLYLSEGLAPEALGMLTIIRDQFPEYYATNKLALLSAAANVMIGHMDTAANDLLAPELVELEETQLWRQVVALYVAPPINAPQLGDGAQQPANDSAANDPGTPPPPPAPPATPTDAASKPSFQYLKFNKQFIRFYPPRIRQRLAVIAADAYIADGQEEKAMAVFDLLMRDGIIEPVKLDAEFALAAAAIKKNEIGQALEVLDALAKKTDNPYIAARARYQAAALRYSKNQIPAEEAAEIIESTRMVWRGDALEHAMLESLIGIYKDSKRYDDILRTQKALLDAFPNHPDTLSISGDMTTLFESIFLDGLGDEMPPLKALSLFYEFRDITPLGEKGDQIIQRLADRLAAIDLLERATQLLENQIKFRSSGESRSKIGARLALLHLLNKHPQEALNVLEVTNFGENAPELQTLRRQLTAEALTTLGKSEEALGVLFNDTTQIGAILRINALWAMKDWTNIVNRAEDFLSARQNLTEPLNPTETEVLLKLAIAYCFEGDYTQLRYLRDYYSGLIPDTAYKQVFDFITNDTNPLDPEDFAMLAQQISNTESFLDTFRKKIAAGKLSETIK